MSSYQKLAPETKTERSKLSGGAIAGIVVASVLAVSLIVFFVVRATRSSEEAGDGSDGSDGSQDRGPVALQSVVYFRNNAGEYLSSTENVHAYRASSFAPLTWNATKTSASRFVIRPDVRNLEDRSTVPLDTDVWVQHQLTGAFLCADGLSKNVYVGEDMPCRFQIAGKSELESEEPISLQIRPNPLSASFAGNLFIYGSSTTGSNARAESIAPLQPQDRILVERTSTQVEAVPSAHTQIQTFRLGINASSLEGPDNGAWGKRLEVEDFQVMYDRGFRSIRLPVRWDSRQAATPPYAIETTWMQRVIQMVDAALNLGMRVLLNVHHYDAIDQPSEEDVLKGPEANRDRLLAAWNQIAFRFRDYPPSLLMMELYNEPHGLMTETAYYPLLNDMFNVVRVFNRRRILVMDTWEWADRDGIPRLQLPAASVQDPMTCVSFHFYEPSNFAAKIYSGTVPGTERTTWGTPADYAKMQQDLQLTAAQIAARPELPFRAIFVGEFGCDYGYVSDAPNNAESEHLYLEEVRRLFDVHEWGWTIFDYAGRTYVNTPDGDDTTYALQYTYGNYRYEDTPPVWDDRIRNLLS